MVPLNVFSLALPFPVIFILLASFDQQDNLREFNVSVEEMEELYAGPRCLIKKIEIQE